MSTWHIAALEVFWVCFALVVYTYALYPLLVFACFSCAQLWSDLNFLAGRKDRRVRQPGEESAPAVSLIIAAYNEEKSLPAKLQNLRELHYPKDKLEIIIVSDGSSDGTNRILGSLPDATIRVILLPERGGKAAALNVGVRSARHDVLVFSDASTMFAPEAVARLVRHFSDRTVGAVCGTLQLTGTDESQQTEGVYWKYERILRQMEARLGATVTASGAIYALRRECYRPLRPQDLLDDLLIPLNVRKLGFRVLQDPAATATDVSAAGVAGEFRRRVRLAVGSFRALKEILSAPMPFFSLLAFFSHKLLRWFLPFLLLACLAANLALLSGRLYQVALAAQIVFYGWALLGYALRARVKRVRYALVAYFLLAMHFAFLVGFWQFLFRRQETTWERVH